MGVSINKIAGVESVNVSLKQGLASIRLKPGNTVTLEQVRKAIQADAFTPKEARITAVGELNSAAKGGTIFKVAGTGEAFPVVRTPHAAWERELGRTVVVSGLISTPANRTEPGTLQITEVSPQAGGPK